MQIQANISSASSRIHVMFVLVILLFASSLTLADGPDLGKGHRILLENGLQLGALAFPQHWDEGLNLANWEASNYTTVNGYHATYSIPTGLQWSLWTFEDGSHQTMAVTKKEKLRYVQLWDEQSIASDQLAGIAAKVATLQAEFPNAMVYLNQYIGSSGQVTLMNYVQAVKPDMLSFTKYPFRTSDDYEGGSPTAMYMHMEMYRKAGLAGLDGTGSQPIPVSMYIQRYAGDRHPTESEMRLQQFGAFASGMKVTNAFLYGTPPFAPELDSTAFVGIGDTTRDEPAFSQIAEINRQSQNLGSTLIRLISTDFRMKMGQHKEEDWDPFWPFGHHYDTVNNDLPSGVASWNSSADPYITNITATNLGGKNDGLRGDAIVGYFNPLDASFTDPGHEDDLYFMIVNGLSDEAGSAYDCRQLIRLDFNFGASGIERLLRRSRETGEVEGVALIHDGGSLYHLNLTLDGGDGDLFKFDNGGTFVPEPMTLSVLLFGSWMFVGRRRRRFSQTNPLSVDPAESCDTVNCKRRNKP